MAVDKKAYYLDVAKNWNTEDKQVIAERWGVSTFSVSMVARSIMKKTGLEMRQQKRTTPSVYTEDFIEELKKAYVK